MHHSNFILGQLCWGIVNKIYTPAVLDKLFRNGNKLLITNYFL